MAATRTADGSAARLDGARADGGDGGPDVRGVRPHADEDAVGHAPRHAQRARPARGDPDRHRPVMWQVRGARGADLDVLAVEERAHQAGARLELLDAGGPEAGEPHRGVAHPPAEQGAARGELVDGGDRGCRDRRVAVDGVGEEGAQHDALGGAGGGGEEDVGVAPPELRVGLKGGVPAEILGAPDVGGEGVDGAGVEAVEAEARRGHTAAAQSRCSSMGRPSQ